MVSARWLTYLFCLVGGLLTVLCASVETPTSKLLAELKTKRQMLPGFHQEFEVTRRITRGNRNPASYRELISLDVSQNRWREQVTGGLGDRIRIFDGQDLFTMESGGAEYVSAKRSKDEPLPEPYKSLEVEWGKAKEISRAPCGFSGKDHTCVVIEAPTKKGFRPGSSSEMAKAIDGFTQVIIDSDTGLWLQCHAVEVVEGSRNYQLDLMYTAKRVSYGAAAEASVFKLPESGMREVKALTRWDEARIKKELAGKLAPQLEATDIHGNRISLSDLKGKTVLLDFWTTWCPPCLADAPALDKLYQKYSDKNLGIIGISVNEERETVEQFLKKHPHSYPVVLTSENSMPRPYQIGAFPTYMVIAPDGTLMTAEEGDQGFGKLRKILAKAGMETE